MSQHPARNTPASSIDEPLYSGCGFCSLSHQAFGHFAALHGRVSLVISTREILNADALAIRLRRAGPSRSVNQRTLDIRRGCQAYS